MRLLTVSVLCSGIVVATTVAATLLKTSDATAAPTRIDVSQFQLNFSEEFDKPLSVSPRGPGTRWIAHTPWNGDFGDAKFVDPQPGFPFSVSSGQLRIEAREVLTDAQSGATQWQSGLLSSSAPDGSGYSLQFGYFEMSAKLPGDSGVWPAFWLVSAADRRDPNSLNSGHIEIDVLEYYGLRDQYTANLHIWKPSPYRHTFSRVRFAAGKVSTGFHAYGVLVTKTSIVYYFDRTEVWRQPTPVEHKRPLTILLNLALGGGWPIDDVPSPTYMYIDYVRAYEPKPNAVLP
jgi:beta-glucanase (GH16 family)